MTVGYSEKLELCDTLCYITLIRVVIAFGTHTLSQKLNINKIKDLDVDNCRLYLLFTFLKLGNDNKIWLFVIRQVPDKKSTKNKWQYIG